MLEIVKIYEWTFEETCKVFKSREYRGFGQWSSVHVSEWFGEEEVSAMALRIAEQYITEQEEKIEV